MNWIPVRAAVVIAAVYGYFLIFAQFSFIELLRAGGINLHSEKAALGLMALAGIAGGFIAAWRGVDPSRLKMVLGIAGLTAALAPFAGTLPLALLVAVVTGLSLGVATVWLSASVPSWCGLVWVGIGTGLGYACCNVPAVFQQSPTIQAWIGGGFALVGMLAVPLKAERQADESRKVFPLWGAAAIFTALVWMDSAAFFIIQHSENLKSGTWGVDLLWRNAAVHLTLGALAGLWLARGGARALPAIAWVVLAVAALAVNTQATRGLAGWFYPAGVSLYSAALVAWPGWFSGAVDSRQAAWRAAWLFAIAGWFGSANGIGMAQSLQHVPPVFVAGAGAVVIGVMVLSNRNHWRAAFAVSVVVLVAAFTHDRETPPAASALERGRQVYLSEGCIHCHSRYVRPGSSDEAIWGPARGVGEVLEEVPVLIGNRRQGPDLTNVGARRSEAWLKLHFLDPRALSPDSAMPSYAHLFEDGRGDDLVRYLKLSGVDATSAMMAESAKWEPSGVATGIDGKSLYAKHCASCHGALGGGHGPLSWHFARPPTNLRDGPFVWTNAGDGLDLRMARVIRFGIPGTDMPGHETLSESQVLALKDFVSQLRRID